MNVRRIELGRLSPQVTVRRLVANQSSRNGLTPRLIVVHDTESHNRPGNADLAAIGEWFDNPAARASAHVCTDGDGNSGRFVADYAKAWSCVNYNGLSLNVEQIGGSTDPRLTWDHRLPEIRETARWLARWSLLHGIPLRRTSPDGHGVVRHMDLGVAGGNHNDPGPGYPLDDLIALARRYAYHLARR